MITLIDVGKHNFPNLKHSMKEERNFCCWATLIS